MLLPLSLLCGPCRLAAHLAARKHYEAELKSELSAVKAKLAAMLAEQQRQYGPKVRTSHSFASIASMKALTMRRLSKSARSVNRTSSSSSTVCTASGGSSNDRAAAAAIAVKAADTNAHKSSGWQALRESQQMAPAAPARMPLPAPAAASDGAFDAAAAASDVAVTRGRIDQLTDAEQVIRQVSKLEQQLADIHAQDAQLRQQQQSSLTAADHSGRSFLAGRQDSIVSLGFGGPQVTRVQLPLPAPLSAAATAAAVDGAVLLDVGAADHLQHAGKLEAQHTGCFRDWK